MICCLSFWNSQAFLASYAGSELTFLTKVIISPICAKNKMQLGLGIQKAAVNAKTRESGGGKAKIIS